MVNLFQKCISSHFKVDLVIKVVLNFHFCSNPLPITFNNNGLACALLKASIKNNSSFFTLLIFFYALILDAAPIPFLIFALGIKRYIDKNFQKTIKFVLKIFFLSQKYA